MDAFTLAGVAAELRPLLIGARLQKVQQPSPHALVLSFFGHAGAHRLRIDAGPTAPRLHLTQVRDPSPTTPPAFCQVARKDLEGTWLEAVETPFRDRYARLVFRDADGGRHALVAELMGRNANVILCAPDGRVRGLLRPIAADSPRPLRPGAPYAEPPGLSAEPASFGRFADAEIAARGADGRADLCARADAGDFDPHTIMDEDGNTAGVWAFCPVTVPENRRFPRESLSVALDTFHSTDRARRETGGRRDALARAIARERTHRTKALADARKTLDEASRADAWEESGNLLLGNLAQLSKGDTEATLDDWYRGGTRTIALDPKRTPQENAEHCFDRARKARDAAAYAEGRAADLEDELEQLAELEDALTRADDDALEGLEAALAQVAPGRRVATAARRPGPAPYDGHKIRTYDLDGWTLLVGENATANDYLMTRVAAPADLWMHVRAGTGAHGVLKVPHRTETPPDPVVRRAAAVVAARSGNVKHSGLVAVDVTPRRYVRKPRGGKAGLAFYTQAKTYDVVPALPSSEKVP